MKRFFSFLWQFAVAACVIGAVGALGVAIDDADDKRGIKHAVATEIRLARDWLSYCEPSTDSETVKALRHEIKVTESLEMLRGANEDLWYSDEYWGKMKEHGRNISRLRHKLRDETPELQNIFGGIPAVTQPALQEQ